MQAVHDQAELLPGVTVTDLDVTAGTVMVTAARPADRADVIAALDRIECRVRH